MKLSNTLEKALYLTQTGLGDVTLIFKSCHLTNSIDVITPCRLTNCES